MNILKKVTLGALLVALISGPVGSASAIVQPTQPTIKPGQIVLALVQIGVGSVAYLYFSKKAFKNIKHVTDQAKKKVKPKSKEASEAIDKFGTLGIWGLCFAGGGFALMYGLNYKSKHIGEIENKETKTKEPASVNDLIYGAFKHAGLTFPEKNHDHDNKTPESDCCKAKIASVEDVAKFVKENENNPAVKDQLAKLLNPTPGT